MRASVVVDTSDFTWKAYGGYLADQEAAMTASNQQRADRCEQAITAYSDDDDFTNLVDFLADAMHWCDCNGTGLSPRSWPRLAGTTSTNSTTNNKTKGE